MTLRTAIAIVTLLTVSVVVEGRARGQESSPQGKSCVLVELFTSEGCSSCPPADRVLMNLQNQQPIPGVRIITLSEHVSYWNYLGWRDPYSSDLYNERQRRYADIFRTASVYTPQMVVDGRTEFVGSDYQRALLSIQDAAKRSKADVVFDVVSSAKDKVVLRGEVRWATAHEAQGAVVRAAVVEDDLHSSVDQGENSGRVLAHSSVVRKLLDEKDLAAQSPDRFEMVVAVDPLWKRQNLRLVVFAQSPMTGEVLGVAESRIGMNSGQWTGQ
jgi:hypothetical protein